MFNNSHEMGFNLTLNHIDFIFEDKVLVLASIEI